MMETMQLRAELFRQMNPMLDSDVMLKKAQQSEQVAAQEKGYTVRPVAPDIEKWSGCATFSQEEIDGDPRLKAILSR